MTGKERQRALAREKVQRQMQRRAAEAQRRRMVRNATLSALAVVVVLGVGAYLALTFNVFGGSSGKDTLAQAQKKTPQTAPTTAFCAYTQPQPGQGGTVARKVNPPSINGIPKSGTAEVLLHTNRGDIKLTLDQKSTPCTAHNFMSLTAQNYFNNTICHRLTTSGLYVLQCGDPTGTGSGGPGYVFPDENLGKISSGAGGSTYPAGSVAMANSGPNTNGSQFFLVYRDSDLPPQYTLFGHVTSGLEVIKQVAKHGVQGGGHDGRPKEPVKIISAKILRGTPGTVPSPAPTPSPSPSS